MMNDSETDTFFSGYLEDIPSSIPPFRMVAEFHITPENIAIRANPSRRGEIGIVISRDVTLDDLIKQNPYANADGFRNQIKAIYNDPMRIPGESVRRLYVKQTSAHKWLLSYV